ncbi:hypothetical protein, partial [Amycolatopsis lexingtonensis]|uniref:hypothetical protein n=1 Tax=Amycolatopsis lexingtonensis TaxID=218822 RepID=UPI001B8060E4
AAGQVGIHGALLARGTAKVIVSAPPRNWNRFYPLGAAVDVGVAPVASTHDDIRRTPERS